MNRIFSTNYARKKVRANYKTNNMLNEKLFDDPKDAEIARLKMTIEKFKEYDKERKKYYADKMQRLGELESYVQEIDTETEIGKLKETIIKLRKEVSRLTKVVQVRHIEETRTDDELSDVLSRDALRQRNRKLTEEVAKLRKEKSEWITKLLKQNQE